MKSTVEFENDKANCRHYLKETIAAPSGFQIRRKMYTQSISRCGLLGNSVFSYYALRYLFFGEGAGSAQFAWCVIA
jgi:hypothetical protein